MPSPHSIHRVARLAQQVQRDLRKGGMGITFRYLFRSTAILARLVTILAEQVAELSDDLDRAGISSRARPKKSPAGPPARRTAACRS
jgi:hypothetical protein